MMKDIIIKKAIITEKTLSAAQKGIFTFEVSLKSTKQEIRDHIEKIFNVHVEGVNTAKIKGKNRRTGKKRLEVIGPDSKKSFIKLRAGEKIDLFEAGESK